MDKKKEERIVRKLLEISNNDFVSILDFIKIADEEDLDEEDLAEIILQCNNQVILSKVISEAEKHNYIEKRARLPI